MHVDFGESRQCIRRILELDPVQLQVLARRKVTVAAIVLARDVGQLAQLAGRQRAVGNGDPQHVGVKLQVEAVVQTQRLELLLRQLTRQPPPHLIAELVDALGDESPVVIVVLVKVGIRHNAPHRPQWPRR